MKEIVSIVLILFFGLTLNSQTIKDTVDISTIDRNLPTRSVYELYKVTTGPKADTIDISLFGQGKGILELRLYSDNKTNYKTTFSSFKNNANYKTSDTIVYLEFDMEKYDKPFNKHQFGIIHFQKNNIITIDKVRDGAYMRREFKILKWTRTEIILKDNSLKSLNRIYYLKKHYK